MKTVENKKPTTSTEKLPKDLYEECRQWRSEIEFWEREFDIFFKLLQKVTKNVSSEYDDRLIENIGRKISQFQRDRISTLKEELSAHENYISRCFGNTIVINEKEFYKEHEKQVNLFSEAEKAFNSLKKQIFSYMEELL